MNKQQPKALRLADTFEHPLPPEWSDMQDAAAELRRLHTETANQQDWYTEWQKWEHASKNFERQRDDLLKALEFFLKWGRCQKAEDMARDAIAKATQS